VAISCSGTPCQMLAMRFRHLGDVHVHGTIIWRGPGNWRGAERRLNAASFQGRASCHDTLAPDAPRFPTLPRVGGNVSSLSALCGL
jgi:hypothetical protein